MRLPWRKREPRDNPWDKAPRLSGWVPGTSPLIDLFALMTSLGRAQWQLAEAQVKLGRILAVVGWCWVLLAFLNLYWLYRVYRATGWF